MLKAVAVVLYIATVYVLVAWVGISIVITRDGPIRWEDGWNTVVEHYWPSLDGLYGSRGLQQAGVELRPSESGIDNEASD